MRPLELKLTPGLNVFVCVSAAFHLRGFRADNPKTILSSPHYFVVYAILEFPGMMMSQMMNRMLLKRSRGRPRKDRDEFGVGSTPTGMAIQSGSHMRGNQGGFGSSGPARELGGYDGIPSSSSTPLLATDPSASAFEMNWMANAGSSDMDRTKLMSTNNSYGHDSTVATTRGGRYFGDSGLFGRHKQGKSPYVASIEVQ